MTSTVILSDNGASSGSAGLKTTGGNDGVLILQTTTSGGTATNAIYVDNTQNVGIGTSSPIGRLDVNGSARMTSDVRSPNAYVYSSAGNYCGFGFYSDVTLATRQAVLETQTGTATTLKTDVATPLIFGTNGSERMRIDTSGIVTGTAGNLMLVSGTSVSASGTSVTFTGIPSWVKRITVMINGLSGSGSSDWLFQIGDSGGIENTGYLGTGSITGNGSVSATSFTAGFGFAGGGTTAKIWQGAIRITNITGNTWVADGVFGRSDTTNTAAVGGGKTLTDVLTQVRITHVNGTDTFDAGTINILYE